MGKTKKNIKDILGSSQAGAWGVGLTVLETSHVSMWFPFSSSPIFGSVFQDVCAAGAGTGEAGGECGTPGGSPGFPQSLSLQTLVAHGSAGGDSIGSTQKKTQCQFPPQHPLVLSLGAIEGNAQV